MEIRVPKFEKKEVEIRETYVDEDGRIQERIRKISVPTGRVINEDNDSEEQNFDTGEKSDKNK